MSVSLSGSGSVRLDYRNVSDFNLRHGYWFSNTQVATKHNLFYVYFISFSFIYSLR